MLNRIFLAFSLLITCTGLVQAEVIKSERDTREYRVIELENSLRAVLVSDPSLDKGAAALTIDVGSNANPADRLGLAHFLEHMLFLGTEKYPEADSYQAFISANGGNHNAFTAYENTTYFFDIAQPSFEDALDRFSQFFIAPLFNPEYVDRERNAVHSEYEAKKLDDGRRNYVADKLTMNPEHAWTAFTVGDLETLSNTPDDPIREDLIAFYQRYYSANLMTLALISPNSLDELEQLAKDYFSAIENRDVTPYQDPVPLYLIEQLPVQLDVKTIKSSRQLEVSFPIPARRDFWRIKPLYYIANQIGYEGEGSLLSYLKSRGWAESLGAWIGMDLPGDARFDISVELTESGLENYESVVEAIFAEIELLKTDGLRESLYEEQKQLAETDFLFSEAGDPSHEVTRLSQMLLRYPEAELIRAPYLFESFSPELVEDYLSLMVPGRMILTRRNESLSTDQVEENYGIEYKITPLTRSDIARWQNVEIPAALQIRNLNPYVAERFDIKANPQPESLPVNLSKNPLVEVWHLQDDQFKQPKGALNLAFLSEAANNSAANSVATAMLARMINEQLNESLYDALLAGLGVDLYSHMRGLSLKVSGYDDKLLNLFESALTGIVAPLEDEQLFERLKRSYREEIENRQKDKPYNQTFAKVYEVLLETWSDQARLDALASLTLADLNQFRASLFTKGQYRLFAHGNLDRDDANLAETLVESHLARLTEHEKVAALKATQLASGTAESVQISVAHNDSALLLYLQADSDDYRSRAEVAVLNEMISAPFYSQLRTEQQLGYIVFSNYLPMAEQPGIALVTQSPVASSTELKAAYNQFLGGWRGRLETQLANDLDTFKRSVASRLMTPSQRLSEETARLWREIDRENLEFDTREQMLSALEQISASDLLNRFDQLMQRQIWVASDPE